VIKKTSASKKRPPNPEEPKEIPDDSFGTMHVEKWREFRLRDPYCYKKRTYTGADKKFWTEGQKQMWDYHYSDKAHFKRGWVVHQHALHMTHYNNYIQEDLHFVDECVKKLGVMDIAAFKYDYYPDVIRQFHCTVYFDDDRNMTWMTGSEQCYGTYADFGEALGYDAADEFGYKVHSESAKPVSTISFCYPTLDRVAEPLALSGMYYSFNALAKFFMRIWFARREMLLTFVAIISTFSTGASLVVRGRLMFVISSSVR
jgi:hypothetical protein